MFTLSHCGSWPCLGQLSWGRSLKWHHPPFIKVAEKQTKEQQTHKESLCCQTGPASGPLHTQNIHTSHSRHVTLSDSHSEYSRHVYLLLEIPLLPYGKDGVTQLNNKKISRAERGRAPSNKYDNTSVSFVWKDDDMLLIYRNIWQRMLPTVMCLCYSRALVLWPVLVLL